MRAKAIFSYDGSFFQGFQRQTKTGKTVTTSIETALHQLHIDSEIVGSGRTDTGVHASGQVIHFDLPGYWQDTDKLQRELNRKLRHIRIKHITMVDQEFHARFSAKRRVYRYLFKRKAPSVFEENYVSHYPSFDPGLLERSLHLFEGEHDFKYFHKTGSDTHTTVRMVYRARYKKLGDYHAIYFEANGFLRSQVRMMVGAAMQCANKEIAFKELEAQLHLKHRYTSTVAPSSGLYLARIVY